MRALALIPLVFMFGCAVPYRADRTTHSVEVFAGRPDGLVLRAKWKDTARGGGLFILTDPKVQSISHIHNNQPAIGGGSSIDMGESTVTVDPQTGAIISAGGTAIGNIIGAAAKTAVGKP